jgi:hypothetical protein
MGDGCFGVSVIPSASTVVIKWDGTVSGATVYAHEDVYNRANIVQVNDISVSGSGTESDPWGP